MDAAQFLARVVPSGSWYAIAFKGERGGMRHRFYKNPAEAAGFAKWASSQKHMEVWHACASFIFAEPDKEKDDVFVGKREQANVQALRSFWLDLDIKREGDGKDPGRVYPDLASAVNWLRSFCDASRMPLPNLWVNSGYGLHLYWVLEDPIPRQTWEPYAEALKQAVKASNGMCDLGVIADSARILRPPGTMNFKDPANPKPVVVLKQAGEFPNQEIYDVLQPYVGLVARSVVGGNYRSGSLDGTPPAAAAAAIRKLGGAGGNGPGSLGSARSNLGLAKRPHYFAEIAKRCEQVKQSLASGGATEPYDLWYRGHLTLADFCVDGNDFVHEFSKGHHKYDPANVDAHVQQVKDEIKKKGLGAPTCASYDSYRTGVCDTCQFNGKTKSPFSLGIPEDDLPYGYRRHGGSIQRMVSNRDKEEWVKLVEGDVYDPLLDRRGHAHVLTFTYELAGHRSYVVIDRGRMPTEGGRVAQALTEMGVDLHGERINQFMGFCVAWITKLRQACAVRDMALPTFGWARDPNGDYVGFAVGGTLYRADGSQQPAPGGDANINDMYRPRGDLQAWKDAAGFVLKGRPDLQVLTAAAFGAPLMEFTGQTGVTISAWSRDSGVGKSSALKAGQSVWGTYKAMCSMGDTHNAARKIIASTRVMPCYWDEMRIHSDERAQDMLDLFFELAQGKDKARLHADTSLRQIEEWRTLLVATSNKSFMDEIEREQSTDAGALRLFEFFIDKQDMPFHAEAPRIVASLEDNAGQAGQVYAEFIAKCRPLVVQALDKFVVMLEQRCAPVNQERLYIAGMACIMTGAQLAHHLGLIDFDRMGMLDFMVNAFNQARGRRTQNLTVANGVTDLDKIIGNFFADHANECLITSEFHSRGRVSKNFKVMRMPSPPKRLAIQIGQKEQSVRIDTVVWQTWCRAKHLPPNDMLEQAVKFYGGSRARGVMGAGTNQSTGRVDYFEIPLTSPELSDYIYDFAKCINQQYGSV